MKNTDGAEVKERAEFTEKGSAEKTCFENFDEVKEEIERQTNLIKGISERPINLKVFSEDGKKY